MSYLVENLRTAFRETRLELNVVSWLTHPLVDLIHCYGDLFMCHIIDQFARTAGKNQSALVVVV